MDIPIFMVYQSLERDFMSKKKEKCEFHVNFTYVVYNLILFEIYIPDMI
jgi:hypothetical protein